MSDFKKLFLILGLALSMSACSSSDKAEDEFDESLPDEIPVADAETDALPADEFGEMGEPVPGFEDETMPPLEEEPVADFGSEPDPMPMDTGMDTGMGMAGSGQYQSYTVQSGDTLMKIAFDTYGDLYQWRRIYEANRDKLQDPNVLPEGVTLQIESPGSPVAIDRNGERYLIKRGDTLGSISSDVYGTPSKWRKLWENNRQMIKNPDEIFAGFYLYYLPEGGMGTSPAPLAGSEPMDSGFGGGTEMAAPSDPGMGDPGMGDSGGNDTAGGLIDTSGSDWAEPAFEDPAAGDGREPSATQ